MSMGIRTWEEWRVEFGQLTLQGILNSRIKS